MPRLQRILIANRGEIAVRIIHACHDTGRTAIAAYADPDADALFVHLADEAYALHGVDAKSTYLNIDAIIETAKKAHADAIHPGYGFLAENADFAEAVAAAGMAWIGPGADTIRMLGSKSRPGVSRPKWAHLWPLAPPSPYAIRPRSWHSLSDMAFRWPSKPCMAAAGEA